MKFSTAAVATLVLATASGSVLADRDHRGDRDHNRRWSGDIHRFHERDLGRWNSGRWHQGRHRGRDGWWWIVGGVWYYYPNAVYPYPDPYVPPVVSLPPPETPMQYWYYCRRPAGYYPYVAACRVSWQRVPAVAR